VKEFPQRAPQGCNPVWFNSEGSEQGTKGGQHSLEKKTNRKVAGKCVSQSLTVAAAWETAVTVGESLW
jgi:hypothetical protein